MGQDLAKKAAPTFDKAWDRERLELKTRDLFTQIPEAPRLVLIVQNDADVRLEPGNPVVLALEGGEVGVQHDLFRFGHVVDPPKDLVSQLAAIPCVAAEVVGVHAEAGIVEVILQ